MKSRTLIEIAFVSAGWLLIIAPSIATAVLFFRRGYRLAPIALLAVFGWAGVRLVNSLLATGEPPTDGIPHVQVLGSWALFFVEGWLLRRSRNSRAAARGSQ